MSQILNLVCTGISIIVCYLVWKNHKLRTLVNSHGCQPPRKYSHSDPVFGLDLFFKTGRAVAEDGLIPMLMDNYQKYGSTFQSLNFGVPGINSIEPENLKTIWDTDFQDWGVQPSRLSPLTPFVGRGFISMDGPVWEKSMALLKPSFRRTNVANLERFEPHLQRMFAQIPKDCSAFDLQPLISDLYLDTASEFLFGESLGCLSGRMPPHVDGFLQAFQEGFLGAGMRIALGPLGFLAPTKKWHRACAKCHRFADHYVDKALEYRKKFLAEEIDAANDPGTILLYNMAEQSGNRAFLRDNILQALMASQETTSNLLSNVFFLLGNHPNACQRLRKEVLSVDELGYNQLMQMKYLQKIIKEALRLYPVLPFMDRHALRDTILPTGGGPDGTSRIHCPRGTRFQTSSYVLHHQSKIWGPDVEEFNPDRWDTVEPKTWEYLPFAAGPRKCAGQQKAVIETSYVVARMLQDFKSIEGRDEKPWKGRVRLTARNANGCWVSLVPAEHRPA